MQEEHQPETFEDELDDHIAESMRDPAYREASDRLDEIEASRKRLNIPDDWVWTECVNGCGDIVWCPPDVLEGATLSGTAVMATCTAKCATEMLAKLGRGR